MLDSVRQTQQHAMCMALLSNMAQRSSLHSTSQKAYADTVPPLCSSGSTLTMCQITQMTAAGEALIAATVPHEQLSRAAQVCLFTQHFSCAHLH